MISNGKIKKSKNKLRPEAQSTAVKRRSGQRHDKETKERILSLYRDGTSLAVLSTQFNVPKSTIHNWICPGKHQKKPKKESQPVSSFREVKILRSPPPPQNLEARISLASGLSIFVPISALDKHLISKLDGIK